MEFLVAPYDPAKHQPFVQGSWTRGSRRAVAELHGSRIVVAHAAEDPDALLGWAAADPAGALVWAYVKDLYGKEGGPTARRRGIAGALVRALGIDTSKPTPCRYWSPAAAAIALAGRHRLVYAPVRRTEEKAA